MSRVLAYISTKGRYETTLPLALSAVINQTRKPDKIIVFDDNDEPIDLRNHPIYRVLIAMMVDKGIDWAVLFGRKRGQHHNHHIANHMEFDWCWRVDDDVIPDCNVLKELLQHTNKDVGAVGGSIITPNIFMDPNLPRSNKIADIYNHMNLQWFPIEEEQEVEHLHCSFLYRSNTAEYNLQLSRVAHREETLFTYDLHQRGFKVLVVPNAVSYHLKSDVGGIRDGVPQMYSYDENIFRTFLDAGKLIVLDCGLGDHIVFKRILPEVKERYGKITIACCYPEVFEGENIISIHHASLITNLLEFNVYKKMTDWKWKDSLELAYRRMYL